MKNITAFALLVIILNSAHCQDKPENERNYRFSLGPQFGIVLGQAFEYVYPIETKGEFLSELRWDMKPIFYIGAQIDFSRIDLMKRPGFFASLSFNGGIPGDSGIMEDRDWRSVENDALTNFSSHTNKTTQFFSLDAVAGASFPIKNYLYIKPFFSGSWMHFSFEARNGYYKYARDINGKTQTIFSTEFLSIDDNPDTGPVNAVVIRYTQDWILIAAGFSVGTKILSPFSFDISFQISPFAYCADKDEHIKGDTWLDYTSMGLYLEPKGRVFFTVKKMELSLELAYRYIGKTKGDIYVETYGGYYDRLANKAGTGLSLFSSQFMLKVLL